MTAANLWEKIRSPFTSMTGIRLQVAIAVSAVLLSLIIPFFRFVTLGEITLRTSIQGRDVLYLGALMLACTLGYAFILFEFYRKRKAIDQPEVAVKETARHIYPMTLMICSSNLVLGLSSYIGQSNDAVFQVPLCKAAQLCSGTSLIMVFPDVLVPNGVILYAFWGAFVFNCFQYLQRIVNNDFRPAIWLYGATRLASAILGSILLFVVYFRDYYDWSKLAESKLLVAASNTNPGWAVAAAFFAGFFPMMTLRVLMRAVLDRLSQLTPLFGKYVHTPITAIDGITQEVQDRLAESGIDSIQMLSQSNAKDLRNLDGAALPYPEAVLNDWIGQAKLALYFFEEADLAEVRTLGIRTYADLQKFQSDARQSPLDFSKLGLKSISAERFRTFIERGQFP
ncbi:MAG: hypothetical protein JNM79_02605 [Burkholderiales bacterium]|nr:hypothetical protein [Burkholderiales bacterium]